jgi:hypothetical protein
MLHKTQAAQLALIILSSMGIYVVRQFADNIASNFNHVSANSPNPNPNPHYGSKEAFEKKKDDLFHKLKQDKATNEEIAPDSILDKWPILFHYEQLVIIVIIVLVLLLIVLILVACVICCSKRKKLRISIKKRNGFLVSNFCTFEYRIYIYKYIHSLYI